MTLNPFKHLDPMGFLMMLLFHVGWAKPVPVNLGRFKNPKRDMALTALAGPVSNILITVVFLFLYGALYIPLSGSSFGSYLLEMIELTCSLSLGLAVFNLIPVPPLDGSRVLSAVLSDEEYLKWMRFERDGSVVMLLLVATGVLGTPLRYMINLAYNALFPIARGAFHLVSHLFYS